MKRLYVLLLLSQYFVFANSTNPTTSNIKAVTVFVDGAQVTRLANINLPEGTTEFSFVKLSPHIQENSIQISGLNGASILSINYAINHISKLDNSVAVTQLQKDIENLKDAIKVEESLMEGYEQEIKIIEENRKLGNDTQVVSLEKLKQFAMYYRQRITELNTLRHRSLKKNRDYKSQIEDIKKQLAELNVDDKIQTGEIKVKLNSNVRKQLMLIIKYNVTNAGWFPNYDLKAKDINQPLTLNYKAHVYQNTGVSWNNIKLTLSTKDPSTKNSKPELTSKYLNFVSRYSNYTPETATKRYDYKHNPFVKHISGTISDAGGMPLPGASVILKGTNIGTTTDFDGNFSLDAKDAKEIEVSYVGYKTASIPIHSSVINLSLQEDVSMLEEVVVVGYGTDTVKSLSGSVSAVNIRGTSTNNYSAKPLYIIDGETADESVYNTIHPDMIANIEILKGAKARSIYGSRATNGVIIITTKKGTQTSKGDIIIEGISNTNFEIKKLASVASNNDVTVIEIENYTVPATFSYFTAPVINENVFLTAKIGNWQQYNLLPGEVNIYFEDSYSGITSINPYAITDSLTVSLGVDPNVIVKRKPVHNFMKTNFVGNNRILEKAYDIEIKNNKSSAIDVVILDRIPISQNKDIKIDDINSGNSDFDTKKGILKWKVNINTRASKTYNFSYSIKYPRYRKINI